MLLRVYYVPQAIADVKASQTILNPPLQMSKLRLRKVKKHLCLWFKLRLVIMESVFFMLQHIQGPMLVISTLPYPIHSPQLKKEMGDD